MLLGILGCLITIRNYDDSFESLTVRLVHQQLCGRYGKKLGRIQGPFQARKSIQIWLIRCLRL